MKTTLKALLLAFAFAGRAHGQGVLYTAGDTWTHHFTNLDYVSSSYTEVGPPTWGAMFFCSFSWTNAMNFTFELFEDTPPTGWIGTFPPRIISTQGTNSGGIFLPADAWQDLDGYARFTVTAGAVLIDSFTFTAVRYTPGSPGRIDTYEMTINPVPEPTSVGLLTVGSFVLWFGRRLWPPSLNLIVRLQHTTAQSGAPR